MTVKTTYWFGWLPEYHLRDRLIRWLGVALAYFLVVNLLVWFVHIPKWPGGENAVTALGFVFTVMLTFRMNNAYDRWWEARKLWGQLINETRNLALKTRYHVNAEPDELRDFGNWISAFPNALRCHLRREPFDRNFPNADQIPHNLPHPPGFIAGVIQAKLNQWNRGGNLVETSGMLVLDPHARALMDVCGGCERIRNTPMATSVRSLFRAGIGIYALLAPWASAPLMGLWSLAPLGLGVGFLLALEITAEEIEEPFGHSRDDLPLDGFCRGIEGFVTDTFDAATPVPSWVVPLAPERATSEAARE